MSDVPHLGLFFGAALVLLLVPGPAVLYIVTQSVDRGRPAGLVSMLGIASGSLVHVSAAVLGLSAIVATSATAFAFVRYAGAAYLVFLGVRRLLERPLMDLPVETTDSGLARLYWRGVLVNALNPKTAVFFLAFLPQFVDVERGAVRLQVAILGMMFVTLGVVTDGANALAAGTAGRWLRRRCAFLAVQRWVAGSVLVGLGLAAAATGRKS